MVLVLYNLHVALDSLSLEIQESTLPISEEDDSVCGVLLVESVRSSARLRARLRADGPNSGMRIPKRRWSQDPGPEPDPRACARSRPSIPRHDLSGTVIYMPPHWGGARGSMARQSGLAVPDRGGPSPPSTVSGKRGGRPNGGGQ